MAKLEPSLLVGMYNGTATLEKQWQFLKVTQLPYDPAIALVDMRAQRLGSFRRLAVEIWVKDNMEHRPASQYNLQ